MPGTIRFCINASTLITGKIANSSERKLIKLFERTSARGRPKIDIPPLDPSAVVASSAPDIRNQITFPLIRDTRTVPNEIAMHLLHSHRVIAGGGTNNAASYITSFSRRFVSPPGTKCTRYKSSIKSFHPGTWSERTHRRIERESWSLRLRHGEFPGST